MSLYYGGSSGDVLADRRYDFALGLAEREEWGEAADLLEQGIALAPHWPPLHFHLGEVLRKGGNTAAARKAFAAYLALDPEDRMGATLKLALMGKTRTPDTLPPGYVQSLFDQYAPRFDAALVEGLDYQTPKQIAAAVRAIHPGPFELILDLGCGTGLAAAEFTDARWIEGVDLSPAMVEQARTKKIYSALHAGSIETFLYEPREPYDLILCADVLVYVGALDDIFKRTAAVMTDAALFAFSVQSADTDSWILGEDHRYAHGKTYIEKCAGAAGLKIRAHEDVVLRQDAGRPVNGAVYICKKD